MRQRRRASVGDRTMGGRQHEHGNHVDTEAMRNGQAKSLADGGGIPAISGISARGFEVLGLVVASVAISMGAARAWVGVMATRAAAASQHADAMLVDRYLVVRCGTLLDAPGKPAKKNMTLVIKNGGGSRRLPGSDAKVFDSCGRDQRGAESRGSVRAAGSDPLPLIIWPVEFMPESRTAAGAGDRRRFGVPLGERESSRRRRCWPGSRHGARSRRGGGGGDQAAR